MGVLACHRNECDNVLCDRYSSEYGYICHECFRELVRLGITDIEIFMASKKSTYDKQAAAEAYYSKIFPMR